LRRSRQKSEESGPKVPGYIVTFSDMVTLLLTFFVLLLTLADTQDAEFYDRGRDAFLKSIRNMGLGILTGRHSEAELGNTKMTYSIDMPDEEPDTRTIDAKAEQLRRIFEKVKESAKTLPPEISAKKNNFSVDNNIHFPKGQAELDDSAKQYLNNFCEKLVISNAGKPVTLYVLGLAPDENNQKNKLIISAMRAEIVAEYIRTTLESMLDNKNYSNVLGPGPKWSVYSWGAGSGGQWADHDSEISSQKHIAIAILTQS